MKTLKECYIITCDDAKEYDIMFNTKTTQEEIRTSTLRLYKLQHNFLYLCFMRYAELIKEKTYRRCKKNIKKMNEDLIESRNAMQKTRS